MERIQGYPFVSTILEFHKKWLEFLGHHCIRFLDISSKFSKTFQLLRSSGNTHTDTQSDYYNPPPTLGLIMIWYMLIVVLTNYVTVYTTDGLHIGNINSDAVTSGYQNFHGIVCDNTNGYLYVCYCEDNVI